MKDKIKKYNDWLIILLVTFVLMFLIHQFTLAMYNASFPATKYFNPIPSTVLLGIGTIDAINIFSGSPTESGFWDYVPALTGILFWSILIPFLFVKGYLLSEKKGEDKKHMLWYPATSLAAIASIVMFGGLITSIIVFNKTGKSSERSRQQDDLRYELSQVSLKATELMILPNELGGGGGSFLGFEDGNGGSRAIQLSDFTNEDLEFEYEIKDAISDSMITVVGKFPTGEVYEDGSMKEVKIQILIKPQAEKPLTMTDIRN